MLDAPVVGRSGKGVATRGEKPGCGLARGGVVTVRLTLEAGIEAPKILRSCSACARAAKTLTSALSLRALDGNVSSCALALRSVPSHCGSRILAFLLPSRSVRAMLVRR